MADDEPHFYKWLAGRLRAHMSNPELLQRYVPLEHHRDALGRAAHLEDDLLRAVEILERLEIAGACQIIGGYEYADAETRRRMEEAGIEDMAQLIARALIHEGAFTAKVVKGKGRPEHAPPHALVMWSEGIFLKSRRPKQGRHKGSQRVSKRAPSLARTALEPYRLGDLMALFGYADADSFRAWRARAQAMGFPLPLPNCTRPLKWDRGQVEAWRAGGGRPAQLAARAQKGDPGAPVDELAAARARLALRARMGSRQ